MPGWHSEVAREKSTNIVTPSPNGATVCKGKARTHTTLQVAREVAHEAPRAHRVVSLEKSVPPTHSCKGAAVPGDAPGRRGEARAAAHRWRCSHRHTCAPSQGQLPFCGVMASWPSPGVGPLPRQSQLDPSNPSTQVGSAGRAKPKLQPTPLDPNQG